MRRRSKKLRAKKCATGRVGASRSHFGNDLPPLEPLRKGVSFKINNDVKYWNAYTTRSVEGAFGTVIAYVSNTDVDGYPTKYCIVRFDVNAKPNINIESSGEFQVWGHFPNNFLPFRQLGDGGDTGVVPERIYILTAEQVEGIYDILNAQQKIRGEQIDNFNLPNIEIPLLSYLNNNYVLKIIFNLK